LIKCINRFQVLRSEQAQRARTGQEEMRERLNQLDEDFKKEQAVCVCVLISYTLPRNDFI